MKFTLLSANDYALSEGSLGDAKNLAEARQAARLTDDEEFLVRWENGRTEAFTLPL